ncbi:hypothetical protein BC937DRAFT_93504 [Endogone sp. FLAS-F59071]|nr:hypothetical protein BC937DRAFT_93504 [Endogone sp. FLAS-F59071]|eukprot:RUS14654.1 hypothetical protein BC937DRAFT_93504 [Endogone sp. FLAS-F59071]
MSLRLQRAPKLRSMNPFYRDTELDESSDDNTMSESSSIAPSASTACVAESSISGLGMPREPDAMFETMPAKPRPYGAPEVICAKGHSADISLSCIPSCMEACLQIFYNRNRPYSLATLEDILKATSRYRGESDIKATDLRAGMRRYNDTLNMISHVQCSLTDLPRLVDDLAAMTKKQGQSVAVIITKSLESIVVAVQNENKPIVVFDCHPRPDLHPQGAAFLLFEDKNGLVKYLQQLMPATLDSDLHRPSLLEPTMTDFISILTLKASKDGVDTSLGEKDLLMLEIQYENLELRQQQIRLMNRFEQTAMDIDDRRVFVPLEPLAARQFVSPSNESGNPITRNTGKQPERKRRIIDESDFGLTQQLERTPYESDFEMAQRLHEEEIAYKLLDERDTVMAMSLQEEFRIEAGGWEFECRLCLKTYPNDDIFHLDECNHSLCRTCAAQYVLGAVLDGNFPCLCPCCKSAKSGRPPVEIPQHMALSVLSIEDQDVWLTMEREYALKNNKNFSFMYCRKVGCGILFEAGTVREAEHLTRVMCPYCQHEWCNKCDLDTWHQGETCQQYHMGFCSRQGCENRRYKLPQNPSQHYNYCSAPCLWKESESLEKTKLTLLDDTVNNLDYIAVVGAFQNSIRVNTVVQAIYQIVYPHRVAKPFLDRRAASQTIRRFHGTRTVQCGMASELAKGKAAVGPPNFCALPTCGPCGIIQNGLKGGYDGQVWSGGTAGTSHGYTFIFPGSTTRVMFLCDAVAGGLAEAAPVREAQLILPRFLILYTA